MTALTVLHCWELDGNWNDSGTDPVTLTDGSTGSPTWSSGKIGQSRSSSSEVSTQQPLHSVAITNDTKGDFTIGWWFWLDENTPVESEGGPSVTIWTGSAQYGHVSLGVYTMGSSPGELWPYFSGGTAEGEGATVVPFGWVQVVWTREGNIVKHYINGQLVRTSTWVNSTVALEAGYFNIYYYNSDLSVKLDQFFIDNTVFSPTQISAIFNSGNGLAYADWELEELATSGTVVANRVSITTGLRL